MDAPRAKLVGAVHGVTLVVPCFNEARRFVPEAWLELIARGVFLVLVDDGSTDDTAGILEALRTRSPAAVSVLRLTTNLGKGEAIRLGALRAMSDGAVYVGFADADGATPPCELLRLAEHLRSSGTDVVLGARVVMLGTEIRRRAVRHFAGRVFATAASLVLDEAVYDTQCGAKFFRVIPALRVALARPFSSRWAFDVELLGRLRVGARGVPGLGRASFVEVPLLRWTDVPGSHLRFGSMLRAAGDLAIVALNLRTDPNWSQRP